MNGNHMTQARQPAPRRQRGFAAQMAISVLLALAFAVAGALLLGLLFMLWLTTALQGAHF